MKPKPIQQAKSADLRGSWPALHRAAERAHQLAAQTGTAVVVTQGGVIQHIYPQNPSPLPRVPRSGSAEGEGVG